MRYSTASINRKSFSIHSGGEKHEILVEGQFIDCFPLN